MSRILSVKFKDYGQIYYYANSGEELPRGSQVVAETDQGLGLGVVTEVMETTPQGVDPETLTAVERLAGEEDLQVAKDNDALARQALRFCRQCIRERELDMKLVDVEVFFDKSKMIFYFTAPGRVDFRELVKDLVREYRMRIELRQIGVRHETQMLGAIGNCGQLCCCRRFLRKFEPVTIKMAKEQNLFLNPSKISGMCGRLLCCLAYEQANYEEFQRKCPKSGKKFQTGQGAAKVLRTNFFRQTISVLFEDGQERELNLDQWSDVLAGKPAEVPTGNGAAKAEAGAATEARTGAGPDRPERSDRPERQEKADRPARADKQDRPERHDRHERPERPDRPDRPDRPERSDRQDRAEHAASRGERGDRDSRPGREHRHDKGNRGDRGKDRRKGEASVAGVTPDAPDGVASAEHTSPVMTETADLPKLQPAQTALPPAAGRIFLPAPKATQAVGASTEPAEAEVNTPAGEPQGTAEGKRRSNRRRRRRKSRDQSQS